MRSKTQTITNVKVPINKVLATVDTDTGEVDIMKLETRSNNNNNLIAFEPDAIFSRSYSKSWNYLYYRTTALEYRVAHHLATKAKAFTNSLEPLNDKSTVREIAEAVDISTGKVTIIFERLFNLGVYGRFEVSEQDRGRVQYWILNPYLSFNGKRISKDIVSLFDRTEIAKAFKS